MKTTLVSVVGLGVVLLGCNAFDEDRNAGERLQLALNRQKWSTQAIHNYSFDYDLTAMIFTRPLHIEVRADTVNQVSDRETGAMYANAGAPTIDSLFGRIGALLSSRNSKPTIQYDPLIGYPTRINAPSDIPDTGSLTTVTNFQQSN